MIKLGQRVLYFDTDSIFFISRPGEYEPKLGDFLGEFTNEINPSEGDFIQELSGRSKELLLPPEHWCNTLYSQGFHAQ